jgi:hypothetical protein
MLTETCFISDCKADPVYFALNRRGKWICLCAAHFTQHAKRIAPRKQNTPITQRPAP